VQHSADGFGIAITDRGGREKGARKDIFSGRNQGTKHKDYLIHITAIQEKRERQSGRRLGPRARSGPDCRGRGKTSSESCCSPRSGGEIFRGGGMGGEVRGRGRDRDRGRERGEGEGEGQE